LAIEDVVINATAQQIEDMATRQISQEITEDSSVDELASAKAVYDAVNNISGGGTGGGIAPLIVYKNVDDDTLATETYSTIFNYVQQGGSVYFDDSGWIALSGLVPYKQEAIFEQVSPHYGNMFKYIIDSSGYIGYEAAALATTDQIGDISSALDELHTYAQGLIAGGATE
jgi:hypothetical protein